MSSRPSSSDPEWKKLKLSFERPYKDDAGNRIPVLEDITPEGQFIYEPVLSQAEKRDANLRRIFQEKGHNFFEINDPTTISSKTQPTVDEDSSNLKDNDPQITEESDVKKTMSIEELFAMRSDIMPQLHVALGEMFHAKELLMALLSNPVIESSQPSSSFSATLVTKPAPIPSVQAFNAQLITGSKDEALRKAAGLFKNAAYRMEKGRARGEKYWVNALKIRRANWGLSPAPLPPGSATGKGADKTSKDFLVSYGLEGSSPSFRRQAIAHLQKLADSSGDLVFPHHQTPRLRISVAWKNQSKGQKSTYFPQKNTSQDLDDILRAAQREIVDQEIFSLLVKAAGRLPTASARVSERLIVIDTPSDVELTFELTSDEFHATSDSKQPGDISELIYYMLRVLMLQNRHPEHSKSFTDGVGDTPSILQPIFELVQYQMLLQFVHEIMGHANNGLRAAGIPCKLSFNPVGENGQEILSVLSDKGYAHMGGEAVLHIDKGHVLRLTFAAPSSLTVHLPQATILILSLPQLSQLLMDEIERSILNRICALGRSISSSVGSTWFIDLNRCVARWEGCVLNFQVSFTEEFAISCSAFCLKGSVKSPAVTKIYRPGQETLFAWIEYFIRHVM